MPLPLVAFLALVVLITFAAFIWMVRRLVGRLLALGRDLDRLRSTVTPALEELQRDAVVNTAELDALRDRLEAWSEQRRQQPQRRWRPPSVRRGSSTVR